MCTVIGSRFSTLGDDRVPITLDGEPALKGFDIADSGVGSGGLTLGERLLSRALRGVVMPEVAEAGVVSCVRLDLEFSFRGEGDPLRSGAGDLGGTSAGSSMVSRTLLVSTF